MNQNLLRWIGTFVLMSVIVLVAPARARAQGGQTVDPAAVDARLVATATLFPTQDTYVDSTPANADTSFADAGVLQIARLNLGAIRIEQRAYLRFDLSAIPQGALVQDATLELFQTTGSANFVMVYQVASDWVETKTTWNNQPDYGTLDVWTAPISETQYIAYNSKLFTDLVQNWVDAPTRNYGLMLDTSATAGDLRVFHSSNNPENQPVLRVTYSLPPIRVCADVACSQPISDATVFNRTTGATYTTDLDGYVLDDGVITLNDRLWARTVADQTAHAVRYWTSGEPQNVTAAAFVLYAGLNRPEMRLILQKPLLVRDLQVSSQWNLEGDPAYQATLTRRIVDASDHLYRFTDGQFALGTVTVYQNYEHWTDPATDLWLHANNAMRPLSYIKGDVAVSTADPMSTTVDFVYEPGHIYMGSAWNRFGAPPTQPTPPGVDTSRDWAAALAHELGHYLLGQFDSYMAVLPSGVVTETFACTGSAMGWVYAPSNQAFVWDQAHWLSACGNTLGALNTGRTEWQTIQTWFNWAQMPESATPFTGTPPLPLTQVIFVSPSGPEPLVNQVFDLDYQANELPSAEARAFLLRDTTGDNVPDRILDQGRPPQEVAPAQVTLTGAQANDRLCVIDINDYADLPDTPRHQFGCELIEAGDQLLSMRRDANWAPVIEVTPLSATEISITVKQAVDGATLRARLYPEHDAAPTDVVALMRNGDVWSGVFNVGEVTASAFVQVWVEEPATEINPRREAIVDYGIGGGAVPGPKQKIGFAPVTSSDGKAFFLLPANMTLLADQFVAIQSMAGTLPLPPATRVFGQAYRLIALPPELVAAGSFNLYLANTSPGLVTAASSYAGESKAIYFWDGSSWERLATTFSTDAEGEVLASAQSRGVGVYAVLVESNLQLYLPVLAR